MFMEKWKRIFINDEPTDYEISNHGRCRNLNRLSWKTKGILKPKLNKYTGYCSYGIKVEGETHYKYVHRLVAEYFISNEHNKEQVNHKDGNKTNNHFSNLEWCTREENMKHCFDNGLSSMAKPVKVYHLNGDFVGQYISITEACRSLRLPQTWNSNFDVGNRQAYGFQWRIEGDDTPVTDITELCKYSMCGLVKLTKDGKFIKYYEKMTLAYRELGVGDNGAISQCCKGNRRSFHGYKWMYARDYFR